MLASLSAAALPSDKNQPVSITADTAHLDKSTGISIFQGNIKLTQGSSVLNAEKLTVWMDKSNQVLKAVATGKQVNYQTLPDPNKPPFTATAQMIQYIPPQNKIILTGNAKAVQGPNTYSAPQITYQIDQETVVSSASKEGRTTIVITPQSFQPPKRNA
jgi:lipopolysaccharide export system protein LptA